MVALGHVGGVHPVVRPQAACEHDQPDGHGDQARKRDAPVDECHPHRDGSRQQHVARKLGDHVRQRHFHALDAIDEHVFDLADAFRRRGAEGGLHELLHHVVAQRFEDGVRGHVREQRRCAEQHLRRHVARRGRAHPSQHGTAVGRGGDHLVDDAVHRVEQHEPGRHAGHRAQQRDRHLPPAAAGVRKQHGQPRCLRGRFCHRSHQNHLLSWECERS